MKIRIKSLHITETVLLASIATGCTGQIPGSFRLQQQEETFSSQQDVNTKIDLLWVVDNSASMDVSQQKLRNGFTQFASRYMQPTWDIRVAVITTDTYMANSAFNTYRNTTIPGTVGYTSTYVYNRRATFQNPSWNPTLFNLSTGKLDSGIKYGELMKAWGPNYARLLPGMHDGPVAALCFELMPYFLNGASQCAVRDNQLLYNGPSHCLNPSGGESSVTQCVNTVENDTVRSGKAIISTMPPAGTPGDAAWTQQLVNDFMVNVSTGTAGAGSERGLGSVLQLLNDNEGTATSFFRAGSLRGIIFISDEEDQTMTLPSPVPAGFSPYSYYQCDQAGLITLNGSAAITGNYGYCCSDPTKNCTYGLEGTTCPSKTVDGFTYTVSTCPRSDKLIPVATVKTQLDTFFTNLDGPDATSPNYFVASIVALTGSSIQAMQTARNTDDTNAGVIKTWAVDRGDRYIQLGNLVSNGSLSMDIGANDYSAILDAIGNEIISKKSTFTLTRAPTAQEDMIVKVVHADGSVTIVNANQYVISGKQIMITDQNFVLALAATDKIVINYQPKTVF